MPDERTRVSSPWWATLCTLWPTRGALTDPENFHHPNPEGRPPVNSEPCKSRPEAAHTFDPVSGWCWHGCGIRDDGLETSPAGNIRRTATRTAEPTTPATYQPALDLEPTA